MIQSKIEIAMSTISFPTINILLKNYSNPLSHFYISLYTSLIMVCHMVDLCSPFTIRKYFMRWSHETSICEIHTYYCENEVLWNCFTKIVFYLLHHFPILTYVVKSPHRTRHTSITLKTKANNILTKN